MDHANAEHIQSVSDCKIEAGPVGFLALLKAAVANASEVS